MKSTAPIRPEIMVLIDILATEVVDRILAEQCAEEQAAAAEEPAE